tara:strand:- start:368 stop:1240 length:873 start_codon:yes stop_codon:yes gene_type:complete
MNSQYNFSEITFCVFCRVDNQERKENLQAMVSFYRKFDKNVKFIISEDGKQSIVPSILELTENDVYTFTQNNDQWRKSEGYNKCIKLAKTNTLVFNDVDAIIHPDQIIEAHNQLNSNSDYGLIYPYNGLFLCTDKDLKQEFIKGEFDYSILANSFPDVFNNYTCSQEHDVNQLRQYLNHTSKCILIGHIDSKGGCVMGRRDNIIKCNGYNPLFKGWGYEDDEFPFRVSKLGYVVGRTTGVKKPCWHLHHFDGTGSPKETQPYYDENNDEVMRVQSMDKEQLEQYKTKWRL